MFEELQVEIEQETVRFLYRVVPAEASETEAPVASRAPRPGAPRLDRPAPTGPAIYDGTTFETVWEAVGDVSARFAPGEPPPAPARDVQPANLPGNAPPRRMTESHGELRAFQGGVEMVAPALSPRPDLAPPSLTVGRFAKPSTMINCTSCVEPSCGATSTIRSYQR